ncbi:MAG: bifunctional enoyl-CoA hydratase/phosphate acetyltransferase, partial [Armatimonadetes bacterium]|nr:bifunctional enoyl-CoA hydratase/phosphate acetyltransferase [Armatimonadota bacterium]
KVGFDLKDTPIVHEPSPNRASVRAASLVRENQADVLMKGHVHTDDFLRGVLDKEQGLRTGSIMSHVFLLDTKHLGRITMVTDGAMNIAPDLTTKAAIIMNAVYMAALLGIETPKVGVLCAAELVNPNMPATLDAGALAQMSHRGQFPRCIVDGPLALDNAVSEVAAKHKGIGGEVAGHCDILLVPNIEAGNILAKSFTYLARRLTAGVLIGAAAPVVLTSRADSAESKMYSLATAMLMSHMRRDSRMKVGKVHF